MKKLLTLILCLFVVLVLNAQRGQTVIKYKMDAVTLYGKKALTDNADTTVFPLIHGEYDVSVQLWPALSGSGDSLNFSFYPQLSASYADDAWTTTSAADSVDTATDSDGIIWYADMKPLRLRIIYTGLSYDTCTVQPYAVYRKHQNE